MMRLVYDNWNTSDKTYPCFEIGDNLFVDMIELPRTAFFAFPLAVIDATTWAYFEDYYMHNEGYTWNRDQLTLGSVRYTVHSNQSLFQCTVTLRAVSNQDARVDISVFDWPLDHTPNEDEFFIVFFARKSIIDSLYIPMCQYNSFKQAFVSTRVPVVQLNHEQNIFEQLEPKGNKGGRPRLAEDDWAWAEVNIKGRMREEVYDEWLEKISPNRRDFLANLRDSYRKVIDPKRKKKEDS